MKPIVFLTGAALLFVGCASQDEFQRPPWGKGVSAFDYSRSLDRNGDGLISQDEWVAAGGAEGRIRPTEPLSSGDSYLTTEPEQPALANLMVRVADTGKDEPMTPYIFRSPPGARVASVEF